LIPRGPVFSPVFWMGAPLAKRGPSRYATLHMMEAAMGINSESDIEANLQIGPTDQGMVRLYVEARGVEIPMDFTPDEARDIAAEIEAAARAASARKS
jgi:hypothetical protein